MSTMDLKGIAWVGNIYQKFEAMCLEVEETMYQDTAKYVENQVQTVGASMKRFYSDVMQDLLPPSCMDLDKVVDSDLSLNAYADVEIHKKSKSPSKKDTLAVDNLLTEDCKKKSSVGSDHKSSFKGFDNLSNIKGQITELYSEKNKAREMYRRSNAGIKRISKRENYSLSNKSTPKNPKNDNRQVACDEITMLSSQASASASVENIVCGSSEEAKKIEHMTDTNVSVDDKIESPVSDVNILEDSDAKKETRLRDVNSNGGLPGESIEMCTNSVLVSQRGSDTGGDDTHDDHSADEVFISHADVIEDNDATEAMTEEIKQDDKSKLEETCVFVDGDKLGFVSQTDSKNRSYKKKFRKAFSLKMRSGRKQEYEQLAVRHGDADTPLNLKSEGSVMPTFTTDLHMVNSKSCESEWELL